uniref:uncharacterized protein LOC120334783 n=1 Tax=Styela clava TaxID=7725 RepID=UPI00193AAC0B|nr:uncharacterized protein LOC120334783 [Styela clava]
MYKKEAFDEQQRKKICTPKNLIIKEGPKSPSTQIFASYDPGEGADRYIVTAHDLGTGKEVIKSTTNRFCVVDGLEAGHSYLLGVKSLHGGLESLELLAKDHVRTAMYDPYPWRYIDDDESKALIGDGTSVAQYSEAGIRKFTDDSALPELWNSSLHVELLKIFGKRFGDAKMKSLLFKCDELGISEARDLKFIESKEVAEEFKCTLKMVELLKLIDYAKDQSSTEEKRVPGIVINSENKPTQITASG